MKGHLGLVFAGLVLPAVCLAEASDYNYVEGNYYNGEISDLDVDGWGVNGSFELTDKVFVAGDARQIELDDSSAFDFEIEQIKIGVGYVFGENSTGSVFGRISLVSLDANSNFGFDDEDEGYELALGMRMNLTEQAEFNATVAYMDLDEGGSDTLPEVGLVYSFTENFAGVVNYTWDSEEDLFGIGVRYYF